MGIIAIFGAPELVLFIMGGVFVSRTLRSLPSGLLQMRGKRICRMAPIHHHYD